MTTREVSELTGIAPGTLRYWRHTHTGPASFVLGSKKVVYRRTEVTRWLEAQEAASRRGGNPEVA
ncbi:helix-turn-helix domain-containing protein [Nocardia sp. NEAU-G5]|uniref:Helix-turn-helix domain-containing protein n=2 Tax=Nocardia albiluteola TaxID=2842303 RepID=A0ABS6B1C7_9NOCA|nr:helix-turn-helix domain-containing protein [Nocardia albiluteola]